MRSLKKLDNIGSTPNIWVITPKNEGFGFPWKLLYVLNLIWFRGFFFPWIPGFFSPLKWGHSHPAGLGNFHHHLRSSGRLDHLHHLFESRELHCVAVWFFADPWDDWSGIFTYTCNWLMFLMVNDGKM